MTPDETHLPQLATCNMFSVSFLPLPLLPFSSPYPPPFPSSPSPPPLPSLSPPLPLPFPSSPSPPLLLLPFPSSHQMERTPLITRTFHARAASMICLLVFCDAFLMGQSLAHMWVIGPSVQMVFALEVSPDTGHVSAMGLDVIRM